MSTTLSPPSEPIIPSNIIRNAVGEILIRIHVVQSGPSSPPGQPNRSSNLQPPPAAPPSKSEIERKLSYKSAARPRTGETPKKVKVGPHATTSPVTNVLIRGVNCRDHTRLETILTDLLYLSSRVPIIHHHRYLLPRPGRSA